MAAAAQQLITMVQILSVLRRFDIESCHPFFKNAMSCFSYITVTYLTIINMCIFSVYIYYF